MKDKYALTLNQNIFLAKKRWDETIYCGMRMENRNVTFPETQTILNGVNVPSATIDDIQAILNMRDAWRFVIDTIDAPFTIDYIAKIQGFVARNEALEWGTLRNGSVGISGVSYVPPVPVKADEEENLRRILSIEKSATEKALDLFCWGTRKQLFWDGNKRTSLLIANKLLITEGKGIFVIKDANMNAFNTLLSQYYETGDAEKLKAFMYDNCIDGIEFETAHINTFGKYEEKEAEPDEPEL